MTIFDSAQLRLEMNDAIVPIKRLGTEVILYPVSLAQGKPTTSMAIFEESADLWRR